MKKIMISLLLAIIMPLELLAYSEYIIPGGENIGITINSKGLTVVGFYKVDDKYIGKETLKVGDIITKIEGSEVTSIDEMTKTISSNIKDGKINITIERNGKTIETYLNIIKEGNVFKTGLYIKEKINGVGTLTYIDPVTKIYGALGHEITMNETNNIVEVRSGNIYESYVNSIDRSANGTVGSKNATIDFKSTLGTIVENTKKGIFGSYEVNMPNTEPLQVADFDEIEIGKAYIYTTIDGENKEKYEIEITKKEERSIDTSKAISLKITDEKLLEETGGVVQGMSGSPIIQNNKIIGAVTHVVVDDVTKGYAIFIRTMLEEGEN